MGGALIKHILTVLVVVLLVCTAILIFDTSGGGEQPALVRGPLAGDGVSAGDSAEPEVEASSTGARSGVVEPRSHGEPGKGAFVLSGSVFSDLGAPEVGCLIELRFRSWEASISDLRNTQLSTSTDENGAFAVQTEVVPRKLYWSVLKDNSVLGVGSRELTGSGSQVLDPIVIPGAARQTVIQCMDTAGGELDRFRCVATQSQNVDERLACHPFIVGSCLYGFSEQSVDHTTELGEDHVFLPWNEDGWYVAIERIGYAPWLGHVPASDDRYTVTLSKAPRSEFLLPASARRSGARLLYLLSSNTCPVESVGPFTSASVDSLNVLLEVVPVEGVQTAPQLPESLSSAAALLLLNGEGEVVGGPEPLMSVLERGELSAANPARVEVVLAPSVEGQSATGIVYETGELVLTPFASFAVTGGRSEFEVHLTHPVSAAITINADGFYSEPSRIYLEPGGHVRVPVSQLHAWSNVKVCVQDHNGQPQSGVDVIVKPVDGSPVPIDELGVATVRATGSDGCCEFKVPHEQISRVDTLKRVRDADSTPVIVNRADYVGGKAEVLLQLAEGVPIVVHLSARPGGGKARVSVIPIRENGSTLSRTEFWAWDCADPSVVLAQVEAAAGFCEWGESITFQHMPMGVYKIGAVECGDQGVQSVMLNDSWGLEAGWTRIEATTEGASAVVGHPKRSSVSGSVHSSGGAIRGGMLEIFAAQRTGATYTRGNKSTGTAAYAHDGYFECSGVPSGALLIDVYEDNACYPSTFLLREEDDRNQVELRIDGVVAVPEGWRASSDVKDVRYFFVPTPSSEYFCASQFRAPEGDELLPLSNMGHRLSGIRSIEIDSKGSPFPGLIRADRDHRVWRMIGDRLEALGIVRIGDLNAGEEQD